MWVSGRVCIGTGVRQKPEPVLSLTDTLPQLSQGSLKHPSLLSFSQDLGRKKGLDEQQAAWPCVNVMPEGQGQSAKSRCPRDLPARVAVIYSLIWDTLGSKGSY